MKSLVILMLAFLGSKAAFGEQSRLALPSELHPQCFETIEVDCADLSQDGCLEGKTLTYKDRSEACERIRGEGSRRALERILEEIFRAPDLKRILDGANPLNFPYELQHIGPSRIQLRPGLALPQVDEAAMRHLLELFHMESKDLPMGEMVIDQR